MEMTRRRERRTSFWPVRYSTCFHRNPASSSCRHTAFFTTNGSPAHTMTLLCISATLDSMLASRHMWALSLSHGPYLHFHMALPALPHNHMLQACHCTKQTRYDQHRLALSQHSGLSSSQQAQWIQQPEPNGQQSMAAQCWQGHEPSARSAPLESESVASK